MREETYRIEREVADVHWWFQGRRRILNALLDQLALPSEAAILDVGCGTGANARPLAPRGAVTGVELSWKALDAARTRPGLTCVQARAERLPFSAATFDLVTALDVLEHLDDDVAAGREIARVLRPGGSAVIFVPALRILWGLQDEVAEHRRRYREAELRRLLLASGLRIERTSYFNSFLFPPILVARLAMRIVRPPVASENELTAPWLDRILATIFAAEAPILARVRLPIGVSLFAHATKP